MLSAHNCIALPYMKSKSSCNVSHEKKNPNRNSHAIIPKKRPVGDVLFDGSWNSHGARGFSIIKSICWYYYYYWQFLTAQKLGIIPQTYFERVVVYFLALFVTPSSTTMALHRDIGNDHHFNDELSCRSNASTVKASNRRASFSVASEVRRGRVRIRLQLTIQPN